MSFLRLNGRLIILISVLTGLVCNRWNVGINWLAHKWAPQAQELGVEHYAHVMSYGIFGQNSFNALVSLLKVYFEVRSFEDETLAKDWLQQKFISRKLFKFPVIE